MTSSARRAALLGLFFATLLGLLDFGIVRTSDLASGSRQPWKYPLLWELSGAYTALAVVPVIVLLARRFPVERARLGRRLVLHLGAMVGLGMVHTLLMWGSRSVLYGLLGWGTYDYGDMRYRFLMEGQKQAVGYWLVYSVVSVLAYTRRAKERELAASRLEKELTEARLAALKMQLEPHFLFNTLNTISTWVYEDPKVADTMLGHLSDFLRLTLKHADVQEVPLATELEFLNAYLEIMKARFEERLSVELEVTPEAKGAFVPHLVLQPLVENSVAHCMAREGAGRIRIAARRCGARLAVLVEDDGPGLAGTAEEALGRGVGLSNTAARLVHLYGGEHVFTLANRPEGGLSVRLEVPFRTEAAR